ncbi:hypothetical protein PZH32_03925 [Adlercreutzia equolifaciens]|uniref:hypothetical protein n=1 Tax=Adlercreutzia equolifaciens TaxID=446660 RepID=UPI0023B0FE13|nr:hypothetical protein [Adlercreutzia equolifaciens]MDE8702107.1 hypothetical protein [Adlercreutzia equolifaciens]
MTESIDGRRAAGQLKGVFHLRREKGQLLVNREAFFIDSLVKQGAFSIDLSDAYRFPGSRRRDLRRLSGRRCEMMETTGYLTKNRPFSKRGWKTGRN